MWWDQYVRMNVFMCVCAGVGGGGEWGCLCVFMDFCCFLVLRVLSYVSHLCRLSEQPGYVFVGDCACLPPSLCHTHTHSASLICLSALSPALFTLLKKTHRVWYWPAIDMYTVISLFNFPFSLSDSWEKILQTLPAEICAHTEKYVMQTNVAQGD